MKRLIPYILVILLSLPTLIHLLRPGYFPMHDDLQSIRVEGMTQCFKEFQLPCRWVADMGYGYGYPQFNYYGPLPYYLMSAFNLLGLGIFDSVKLGFALSLILGNLTMFALAKALFGDPYSAFLSVILYAYNPYRASDLYSRGAMGESWAFVFLPLILLQIRKLAQKPSLRTLVLTGVSFALLFSTHNITTLIFTPLAFLWALLMFFRHSGKRFRDSLISSFKWFSLAVLWGVILSAFFLLPVIFEKQFAHTETMIGGYFDYRAHFVTLKQMFLTSFWGFGSSEIGPTDDLSFFFSPLLLFSLLSSSILLIRSLFKRDWDISLPVILLVFMGLLSAFMSHEKSAPVWALISPLVYLQFPWRFLVLSNFFFSLSAGFMLYHIKASTSRTILAVLFVLTFLFSASFFRPLRWLDLTEREKFSGTLFDRQMTISIFDYLPTSADTPPTSPAPVLPTSSVRESSITDYLTTATNISFTFETGRPVTLKLNRLYFPGWEVRVNGKNVPVGYGSDGNMFINLTPGKFIIDAHLKETPLRLFSDLLTLISLPVTFFILLKTQKHGSLTS